MLVLSNISLNIFIIFKNQFYVKVTLSTKDIYYKFLAYAYREF